jgi:hypothetical protein
MAELVPMAQPHFCRQYVSPNWKILLFFMISVKALSIELTGMDAGSLCQYSVSHRVRMVIPWSVSMFEYIIFAFWSKLKIT